ncbi:hypothetical protein [Neptuniibacter halophilus]|uniref:hypothetical protein n=1 Tax=Neptuniibacter halophilus TaxID=651666 RepID=UPI002572E1B2|nr:hypothetical protein [Neptuniibacter halophilus]
MSVIFSFLAKHRRSFCAVSASILLIISGQSYSAQVENGQVVLDENNQIRFVPVSPGTQDSTNEIYMLTSGSGVVKGMYPDKKTALSQPLKLGDSVQVVAVSNDFLRGIFSPAENMEKQLEELAREVSKNLLDAAKASACGFDPLPVTISPTVEVSFTMLAGGSFSLQATWNTADLCSP